VVLRLTSILALLLVIAGCGPGSASMPADLCVNRVVNAVLTVDADDPRMIWATNAAGIELRIRLPDGYGVTPEGELVNADGQVIADSGDHIVGGCADLLQDALLISEANIQREP
jgi:hypothetical protein